jgi:hypothetical protein
VHYGSFVVYVCNVVQVIVVGILSGLGKDEEVLPPKRGLSPISVFSEEIVWRLDVKVLILQVRM